MANSFKSEIWVEKDDEQANGKSIMALMMLAAAYGAKIRLTVEGKDENEAMTSLEELVEAGFYEAETPDPSSKLSKTGTTV